MEPFLGEIRMFGGDFAPRGWAACDGQALPIAQNAALYSVIGTTYGGDGRSFNLPNLQGRAPIHRSGTFPLGKGQGTENLSSGGTSFPGYLAVTFIIAVQGLFPGRP